MSYIIVYRFAKFSDELLYLNIIYFLRVCVCVCETARLQTREAATFRDPSNTRRLFITFINENTSRVFERTDNFLPPFSAEKFASLPNRRRGSVNAGWNLNSSGRHVTYRVASCDAFQAISRWRLVFSYLTTSRVDGHLCFARRASRVSRACMSNVCARQRRREATLRISHCIVRAFVVRSASRARPRERAACEEVSARGGVKTSS